MRALRSVLVWLHRWVGLSMTVFLLVEGLTGAVLAFEGPIGRWLDPPPRSAAADAGLPRLDLGTLAMLAERQEPNALGAYFTSTGPEVACLRVLGRIDPATGQPRDLPYSHLLLDTRSGQVLGRLPDTRPGRPLAGRIMPFVKDLHYTLALGEPGRWALYVVALAWTIDGFAGVLLTLPLRLQRFLSRWRPAWSIKTRAGAYRLNFDLHRAPGLWCWMFFFAFAWSSVQFEDRLGTYDWVMGRLFTYSGGEVYEHDWPHRTRAEPLRLGWPEAQRTGARLISEKARREGFRIIEQTNLVHFLDNGLYNISVRTDRRFPSRTEVTVFFDGDTGEPVSPPGLDDEPGNVVSDWLRALHMAADPLDDTSYRILVALLGLALSVVSITGVVIWLRKRRARGWARTPNPR